MVSIALAWLAWAAARPPPPPPVTAQIVLGQRVVVPGDAVQVGVALHMPAGWHLYWQHPGDAGQPPTAAWALPAGASVEPWAWPAPQALPSGPLMAYGYTHEVVFPSRLQLPVDSPGGVLRLAVHVAFLACAETCIPGAADAVATVDYGPVAVVDGDGAARLAAARARLPQPMPPAWAARWWRDPGGLQLAVDGPTAAVRPLAAARFIPHQAGVIEEAAAQAVRVGPAPGPGARARVQLQLQPAGSPAPAPTPAGEALRGVLVAPAVGAPTAAWEVVAEPGPAASPPAAGWGEVGGACLLALGGGALLNLMPCVFPLLAVKLLSLVRRADARARRRHALAYGLGVLTAAWALWAAMVAMRAAGRQIGWGFQLQSPATVAALAVGLFVLALGMLGALQVGGALVALAGRGTGAPRTDLVGAWGTGVLATVVAAPCTAPWMGAAVGFAVTQPAAVGALVLTALGVGLAAPYQLLCLAPGLTARLPRPGPWMVAVERAMGMAMAAAAVWLLAVLAAQVGAAAVVEVVAVMWAAAAVALAGRAIGGRAGGWATLVALVTLVAAAGWRADRAAPAAGVGARLEPGQGLAWQAFSPEALAAARAAHRRVLVDVTAAWCITCQVNERVVFGRDDVARALRSRDVLLLRADWTRHDPAITALLSTFGRAGVPATLVYAGGPDRPGLALPEILTPGRLLAEVCAWPESPAVDRPVPAL